jgi:putative addiction module component (TIGR02574 family)
VKKPFELCQDKDLHGSHDALLRAARKVQHGVNINSDMTSVITNQRGVTMNTKELINSVLKLPPVERFALIDEIAHSLDRPDPELDRLWIEEAERRLAAYRSGQIMGIPAEDVVGKL